MRSGYFREYSVNMSRSGFDHLEIIILVVHLFVLINGIIDNNFDADGFLVGFGILGRFDEC